MKLGTRSVVVVLVGLNAALPSCREDARATDCAADMESLRGLVAADKRTGALLYEVDALAVKGSPLEAASKIDGEVAPAAERATQQARAFRPRTRWGSERKQELVGLIEERRESSAKYGQALRSEVIQRVVEQMERQTELERRALRVESKVLAGPGADSGACSPP